MRHQVGANLGHRQRVQLWVFGEVGHQPFFTHHRHRFQNPGQLVELGFDFAQFDAHATDFHLVIVAPQVIECAVRQPAHQVAGAVHASFVERVAHKALGGQFRAVEVTACHALAAHVQLPRHPQRHRTLVWVEHVDLGIGHGLADMQRLARLDLAGSGHHRGFGGPVVVDQLKALRPPELAQAVATDQQGAQGRVLDVLTEGVFRHRRRQKAHVQWLRAPPGQQCVDIFAALMGRWQVQGGAHTQRRPHFPGHRVKAETGNTGGMPPGAQVEGAAMPVHQVGDAVVFHHHPLGQASGAGGVDHIGEIRRADGDCGVARRMVLPGEAVQVDHRHFQHRQARQQRMLGEYRHRRAVAEQIVEALGRVGRVHRHITGAGLENRQQPGQGVEAAPRDNGHAVVGLDPQRQQMMRQQVGLLVQFGVSQLPALMHSGNGVRRERGLGFDAAMQGGALGENGLGGVELFQQQALFGGGHHRELIKRGMGGLLQCAHQVFQRGVQVGADALRVNQGAGQQTQAEALTQVVHAQGQRVVGALLGAQCGDTVPGRHRLGAGGGRAVAIVEQRAEQRRRREHATATLGQGQRRVLMAQQGGQACVGGLDCGAYVLGVYVHAKRQGIDENAQGAVGVMAALHAPHQYGAEHHLGFAGQHPQHLGPTQVKQAGGAHAQLARLPAQALGQCRRQWQADFSDTPRITLHVLQTERQGGLADIAEHLPEETFVLLLTDPQPRLRHIVAKRYGLAQGRALAQQARLHFVAHHVQGAVVERHVMEQQGGDDALVGRVFSAHQAQQRRLGDVEAIVAGIKQVMQLRGDIAIGRVQHQGLHRQACLAPHHLRGLRQAIPDHPGTQDVVTVHHPLQRLGKRIETRKVVKGELRLHHIGVTLLGTDMVEQDAFLQRRQRVDVLDIRHAALHRGDNALDLVLAQGRQGQHLGSDALGIGRDAIGRYLHLTGLGRGVFTGLDQFDQRRLVFTQGGQYRRVAQGLLVAVHRQLLALERQLHILGFQGCQQLEDVHRTISIRSVIAA